MSQRLLVGLLPLLILAGGAFLWWSLSGPDPPSPPQHRVSSLSDSVQIQWTARETALVNATTATDALAAIGYVHGINRAWTVTVWRRTALGTLSSWFGRGLVPLDRHARRLGFARHAKQTFDQLPDPTQRHLRAYTRGLNAALQTKRVRTNAPFVALNLRPNPWAPWHPLAVERLLAWGRTDFSNSPKNDVEPLESFRSADRRLRRWLHLHGHSQSVAWAASGTADTAQTALFSRHVLGAVADPIVQEIGIYRPDAPNTTVASLPGAPLFPTGTTDNRAWTYLLGSGAQFTRVNVDSTDVHNWHERISPTGGAEQLVRVYRHGNALMLEPPSADSAWVVQWPGFQIGSDTPRWLAEATLTPTAAERGPSAFHLIRGDGLSIDSTGNWTVRGEPPVVERSANAVLVSQSPWARSQAEVLRDIGTAASPRPAQWTANDSSAWAAQLLPRLLPGLSPLSGTNTLFDDALVYLRNWDYTYDAASIGAVLFERWMDAYRAEIGHVPSAPDPAYFSSVRARRAFRGAVNRLEGQYGTDVRQWRWERIAETQRHFLVWSADSLVSLDLAPLNTTQFAPLPRPGRGHASTLSGGPTLVDPPPLGSAPTHWEGWTRNGRTDLTVRRLRFNPSAFFARSLLRDERPNPVSTTQAEVTATTLLLPENP